MHSLLASSSVDAASQALVPKNKAAPLCCVNPIGTFQFLHLDNAAPTLRRQANTQFAPRGLSLDYLLLGSWAQCEALGVQDHRKAMQGSCSHLNAFIPSHFPQDGK